jgi:hypothetical protein
VNNLLEAMPKYFTEYLQGFSKGAEAPPIPPELQAILGDGYEAFWNKAGNVFLSTAGQQFGTFLAAQAKQRDAEAAVPKNVAEITSMLDKRVGISASE